MRNSDRCRRYVNTGRRCRARRGGSAVATDVGFNSSPTGDLWPGAARRRPGDDDDDRDAGIDRTERELTQWTDATASGQCSFTMGASQVVPMQFVPKPLARYEFTLVRLNWRLSLTPAGVGVHRGARGGSITDINASVLDSLIDLWCTRLSISIAYCAVYDSRVDHIIPPAQVG